MKKVIFFLYILPIVAAAQYPAPIFIKPNNSFGTRANRGEFDSTLYYPPGCGVPTDSTFLFSMQNAGKAEKPKLAAWYRDTCGHHTYTWDPATKTWSCEDCSVTNLGASNGIKAGTFSSRPSASSLPFDYYWSTDSIFWSYSDGIIWHDLKSGSGGGGGGIAQIFGKSPINILGTDTVVADTTIGNQKLATQGFVTRGFQPLITGNGFPYFNGTAITFYNGAASTLYGTNQSGATGIITLGSNLSMTGNTLNAAALALASNATIGSSPTLNSGVLNIDTNRYAKIFNVVDYGADPSGVTDATTAIQNTINAAYVYGNAKVVYPIGTYKVTGPVRTDCNCQIYIPADSVVSHAQTIIFEGEGVLSPGNNNLTSPFNTAFSPGKGAIVYSTYAGEAAASHAGTAIFGSISPSTSYFNTTAVVVNNMMLTAKNNPNGGGPEIGGFNGRYLIGLTVNGSHYQVDTAGNSLITPVREISGFEFPDNSGGANYYCTNSSASGIRWGFVAGEHVNFEAVMASQCWYGFGVKRAYHGSYYGRIGSYWNVNSMAWYYPTTGAGAGLPCYFTVGELDVEFGRGNTGKYYNSQYIINDSANLFKANVNYIIIDQQLGVNNSEWAVNGAQNVFPVQIGVGANFNTSYYVQRWGDLTVQPYAVDNVILSNNAYFNGLVNYKYIDNGYAAKLQFLQGSIIMATGGSIAGTSGGNVTYSYPFVMTNTNDIGLGGNMSGAPVLTGGKLTVNGTSGNVNIASLATGGTAPTQTGTVDMVTCDANGLFSFQAIPSGGGGAADTLTAINSVHQSGTSTNDTLQLVNDQSAPGNNMGYGTNSSGSKGWYSGLGNNFSQTANGTALTNSTTTTNITGTGVGSTSIPANTLNAGDVIVTHMTCQLSTAASPGSLNINTIFSGTGTGLLTTPAANLATDAMDITIRTTILTTGSGGTCNQEVVILISATSTILATSGPGTTPINTTIANNFGVQATWGTASSSNSIQSLPAGTTVKIN